MSLKSMLNKGPDVPVVGKINVKGGLQWIVMGFVAGVVLLALSYVPVVGPAIARGMGRIRGYFGGNRI